MSREAVEIVKKFKKRIAKKFGDVEVILFGSSAGEITDKESDIDVAVVVGNDVDPQIRESIYDIAYDIELENDVVLDVVVYSKKGWEGFKNLHPLVINIERHGIRV